MNRIKALRNAASIKQADLAKAINVSQASLSGYETGKFEADIATYSKIADFFHVSLDYLLGTSNVRSSEQAASISVPVLGSIPAGIPLEAVEDIQDWEEIPAAWTSGGREYFGLKVKGDSMYPKYLAGDTVILRKQSACDSGDDCAVLVNGYDATLKQVFLYEDGSVETRPVNPAYPPRTYTPKETAELPVSIAGVVVELRRKIK